MLVIYTENDENKGRRRDRHGKHCRGLLSGTEREGEMGEVCGRNGDKGSRGGKHGGKGGLPGNPW
jgi:hypothetical protein